MLTYTGIIDDGILITNILVLLLMIAAVFIFRITFNHYIRLDMEANKIVVLLSITNKNKLTRPLDNWCLMNILD